MLIIPKVFVPGMPFQLNIMFAGKTNSLPLSVAPERCFTQLGAGLTRKHRIRIGLTGTNTLGFMIIVNYARKKFYNIGPCASFFIAGSLYRTNFTIFLL